MNPFAGGKIFQHMERLAEWQAGRQPPPVTVEIQVGNRCSHACPACTFSHLVLVPGPKDSIPFDLLISLIDQLADIGAKAVTFSGGGEPMLYKRLMDAAKHVRGYNMDVALITNGDLLTDPTWLDLCEWIRVSLDSYDVATFQKYHGKGEKEFNRVLANIRLMAQARAERLSAGLPAATLGVGYLTDRTTTATDVFAAAKLCGGIAGLSYLQFRPLVVNMVADKTLTGGYADFTASEKNMVLDWIKTAHARFGNADFSVLGSEDKYHLLATPGYGKTERCHGHFLESVVAADGCLYRCCHTAGDERFRLGDLRTQTFADIWRGQRNRDVHDSVDPRESCPSACRLAVINLELERLMKPVTHKNYI